MTYLVVVVTPLDLTPNWEGAQREMQDKLASITLTTFGLLRPHVENVVSCVSAGIEHISTMAAKDWAHRHMHAYILPDGSWHQSLDDHPNDFVKQFTRDVHSLGEDVWLVYFLLEE